MLLSLQLAVGFLGLDLLYLLGQAVLQRNGKDDFLKTHGIQGVRDEWFGWARARLRSMTETSKWCLEGYAKFHKANIPFAVPTLDQGIAVVLPRQQIKKVYGLPESVLDCHKTQLESMQMRWTFPDMHLHKELLHINVVRNQLTQNIPRLTSLVAGEIIFGFDRSWGSDMEWKEVGAWNTALRIIAGAANGAFCGQPLCRDLVFLDRLKAHALTIFSGAIATSCLPIMVQPIFGPVLSWVCTFMGERATRISKPFVKERLENTARLKADAKYSWTPPNDALQWMIDECYASPNAKEQLDPGRVANRLLLVNDVSMLTTAYTAQNSIFDLFSTDPALGYADALREECAAALGETGGEWTHETVKKLQLVDSAIRESMRLSPFGSLLLPRKVTHPDGIAVEGWNDTLPNGTRVALPVESIHYDDSIHPNAQKYDPFRFAHPDLTSEKKRYQAKSTVTLDDGFLSFGVPGRNACPGRFFAVLEIKIFVAHMLLNYDIEPIKTRPKPIHMMWANYPPDAKLRMRRRAVPGAAK